MKRMLPVLFGFCSLFFSSITLQAQARTSIVNGYAAEFYAGNRIESATKENVLKWAKELNTELGKIYSKLSKINPQGVKGKTTKKLILDAKALAVQIIRKGKNLGEAEAKKHDKWFWNGMSQLVVDCLETNPGSECCFSCNGGGQGYQHFWCKANCFIASFPNPD